MGPVLVPNDIDSTIQVPFLTDITYDFRGFESFGIRHGLCRDTGRIRPDLPPLEMASRLQSWLYFGLLAECTGRPIHLAEWTQKDLNGKIFINSNHLGNVLADWRRCLDSLDRTVRESILTHVNYCLDVVDRVACEVEGSGVTSSDPLSKIVLSLRVLVGTLTTFLETFISSDSKSFLNLSKLSYSQVRKSPILRTYLEGEFLRRDWCPHHIKNILWNYDLQCLVYLSQLDRSGFRKNDHQACHMETRCVANNVNWDRYATKHTREYCDCQMIKVPYEEIVEIIADGGVPLISVIKCEPTGSTAIRVERRTARSRYVAMSHVWSDGLGNPSENALPQCQLERIQSYLLALPNSQESAVFTIGGISVDWRRLNFGTLKSRAIPLFWMDTLCIPVKAEHALLRHQAINQMASIYAAAVQVLVLDSELQQTATKSAQAVAVLSRILFSVWMGRSWTLQEGILGRECVYQFADNAVDPVHEWCATGYRLEPIPNLTFPEPSSSTQQNLYRSFYDSLWNRLHQDWKSSVLKDPWQASGFSVPDVVKDSRWFRSNKHLRKLYLSHKPSRFAGHDARHFSKMTSDKWRVEQFVRTWNELAGRSTTMADDIHVIVANLLDFSATAVMGLETREERMRAMLLSFKMLPFSLFYNAGVRFEQRAWHRNRWLPVEPSKSLLTSEPTMKFTDKGLILDTLEDFVEPLLPLYVKSNVRRSEPFEIFLSASQKSYLVTPIRDLEDPLDIGEEFKALCIVLENNPAEQANGESRGACFIVSKSTPELEHAYSYTSENSQELHAIFDCPVRVQEIKSDESLIQHCGTISRYETKKLPLDLKLIVQYDVIPNFRPLHRRPLSLGPFQEGNLLTQSGLIFLILPAIGCLIAFAVLKARSPHKFPMTAKKLLIVFAVLYVCAVLIPVLWYFSMIPLTFRTWLDSFEDDWKDKEKGWWAWYVSADKGLSDVEQRSWDRIWEWICGLWTTILCIGRRRKRGELPADNYAEAVIGRDEESLTAKV